MVIQRRFIRLIRVLSVLLNLLGVWVLGISKSSKMLCWLNRCGVLFITKTLYFIEYLVLSFFLMVAFWRLLFIQSALMRGGVSCWLVKSSIKVQFGGLGMVKKLMFGIIVGCLIPQIVELYL